MKHPEVISTAKSPRFNLGKIFFTPGVIEMIDLLKIDPFEFLCQHASGDWGSLCPEDMKANEDALRYGSRILSSYEVMTPMNIEGTTEPVKIWIITEADRSVTTMLLPSEY